MSRVDEIEMTESDNVKLISDNLNTIACSQKRYIPLSCSVAFFFLFVLASYLTLTRCGVHGRPSMLSQATVAKPSISWDPYLLDSLAAQISGAP